MMGRAAWVRSGRPRWFSWQPATSSSVRPSPAASTRGSRQPRGRRCREATRRLSKIRPPGIAPFSTSSASIATDAKKEEALTTPLVERFGTVKPVIAMLHFPGLPGRPWHDRAKGRGHLVDVVGRDLEVLQAAGVDGFLFCNEADVPYQLAVGPEIPTAMAAVIGELRPSVKVPFGVNVLWDARASLALARATGATFIREVLTGVYESDLGMLEPKIGEIAGYRTMIGADDVMLFDNITPEFASAIGSRGIPERAKGAKFLGADAILISGPDRGGARR